MTKVFSRCGLVALATALVFTFVFTVASVAQAETWKIAMHATLDSPEGKGHLRFAESVDKHSGGKLKVVFFPSEQLGKKDATFEQLSAGVIQIYSTSLNNLQKWVPDITYTVAPYLFENRGHWERFMESDLVKGWLKQVEEKAGVIVLKPLTSFIRGPYRVTVSMKPINSLKDIKGLKLRMSTHKMQIDSWTYLGAEVIVLGWSSVYDGLRRGIIDATNSPMGLVEGMKFDEVVKYVVRTDDFPVANNYVVNAKAYYGLSPELRSAVDRAWVDGASHAASIMADEAAGAVGRIKAKGIKYVEFDTSDFSKRMAQFYKERHETGKLPAGFLDTVNATR
jgi:TRAP-type C4-dicarboxylate transport system substrate-binding protein